MRLLLASVLIASTWAGCGEAARPAELADLRRQLDEAQRLQAGQQKKIESLEDRVFLLTDQLESQRLVSARAPAPSPRLPVVTLRPDAASGDRDEPRPEPPASQVGEGDDVEYRGDAARTPRPDLARPIALAATGVQPETPRQARDAAPLQLYREATEALKAGRHDEAARLLRELVQRFPHHDLADNAQYWLGECFYDRKQFREAAAEFRTVVARWPLGNKAPDALVKLGFSLLALGDAGRARETLREVLTTYPHTEAARLAEARLGELHHPEGTQ